MRDSQFYPFSNSYLLNNLQIQPQFMKTEWPWRGLKQNKTTFLREETDGAYGTHHFQGLYFVSEFR